jgi:WD40 repeat protein
MRRAARFLGGVLWMCAPLQAVPVTALVFSPDGAALVSNGDRAIEVRSPKDAEVQRRIECPLAKVTALAFSPDGHWLAVAGGEPGVRGEAMLFSWPDGGQRHRFGNHRDVITSVAIDSAGRHLGTASADHSAKVWTLAAGVAPAETFTLSGHSAPVLAAAFSPDTGSIVTASADRSLKVWSVADGRLQRSLGQHTEAVHALAFRPAKEGPATCASGGDDRTVRLWQPEIGRMVRIVRNHGGPVLALAWSPDGRYLFSAGQEGLIRRINGDSDVIEQEWRSGTDWIYALAVSPDDTTLAAGDWSGRVRLHSLKPAESQILLRGGTETELAPHGTGNVYAPEIHRDGDRWLMWYGGQGKDGHDRIHLAESGDGLKWKKLGVVLDCGTANHVNDPSVVRAGNVWWMFYTVAETGEMDEIAAATSPDGVKWEKRGVVLKRGASRAWDSLKVGRPSVLHEDGLFRLWYDGQPTGPAAAAGELAAMIQREGRAVGYAESRDGLVWQRRAEPVHREGAGGIHVTRHGQRLVMVIESGGGVKWAVSKDGLQWQSRGMLHPLSGSAADRFGQVTPFLLTNSTPPRLYFGAAARQSWDGNAIAAAGIVLPDDQPDHKSLDGRKAGDSE